jgi:hypothetical protein
MKIKYLNKTRMLLVCTFFPKSISAYINKQEGHDGPEIAHLYIGNWAKVNLKPGAFI